jgi:thiol-disulfide isomerase/thioredoxin
MAGLIWGCLAVAAPAAPPEVLSAPDLVNHPDRWPASVTLQRDYKFTNGPVAHQGDKVRVIQFDGTHVTLLTSGNIRFSVTPEECGFLDAANQAWAALTPAQRAVDPASISADLSLWPPRVALTTPVNCSFGALPAGTEMGLVSVSIKGPVIAWPNSPNRLTVNFGMTDLLARAQQAVLLDPDKRPSRIAAALQPLLVDADGKPYHDDHLDDKKFFAFYFGANWCAPCHAFSPGFVKFLDATMPQHPELAVVLMSNDPLLAQTLTYMRDEKMPFPAVSQKDLLQSSLLSSYAAKMIPHLIIVDRFGRVLATSDDASGNRSDPMDTVAALGKMLAAPTVQM